MVFEERERPKNLENNLGYLHPAAPGEFSTSWKFARLVIALGVELSFVATVKRNRKWTHKQTVTLNRTFPPQKVKMKRFETAWASVKYFSRKMKGPLFLERFLWFIEVQGGIYQQ